MDCYSSTAASQNFMKDLAQSDLSFLSYSSGCITTPKIKKTKHLTLTQDMVKFNGPSKSKLA